jgi:hypothetical protein
MACSKSDQFWCDDFNGRNLLNDPNKQLANQYAPGTSFNLSGLALYKTWEVTSGKIWQDVGYECLGTLEFLEGRTFRYTIAETRPNGNAMEFYGKISASGTLTFQFPSPLFVDPVNGSFYITDVIKGHACAEIWGPGVEKGTLYFNGKFDGTRFTATAKFMAKVSSPCPTNDIFPPELVNGNLHWTFSYDLTID